MQITKNIHTKLPKGFSIVELLVVIVIIGILASMTLFAYNRVSKDASLASLKSDMANAAKVLEGFYLANGNYPETINCAIPDSTTSACVRASSDNLFDSYTVNEVDGESTYGISISNPEKGTRYRITSSSPGNLLGCPVGFIVIPGSSTYGTSDFCAMKYEAKQIDWGRAPVSQASVLPWTDISYTYAEINSKYVKNCSGCHLMTNAEWMTIAQNVMNQKENWTNGAVGDQSVFVGHEDTSPNGSLEASSNDKDGYYGTLGDIEMRRTLVLSNGEVIWDFAGNVAEWVYGTVNSGQPGISGGGFTDREWYDITVPGTILPDSSPAGTGIAGAEAWGTREGMGTVYSNADSAEEFAIRRGGGFNFFETGGILSYRINWHTYDSGSYVGFRVAK